MQWRNTRLAAAAAGTNLSPRLFVLCITVLFLGICLGRTAAQPAPSLSTIRTVDVGSFGPGEAARALRLRVVERINRSGKLKVGNAPEKADAILRGTAVIWATGTVGVNPRSHSYHQTNYNGYASIELVSETNEPLWSYLVTPGRFRSGSITNDLADHAAARLLEALAAGGTTSVSGSDAANQARVNLHAAGATLPAPLYRKWFESAGFAVTYDAVGSEAGIDQLKAGKVDFAASDMPPLPEDPIHVLRFPTVVGGVVPIYNLPGLQRTLRLTSEVLAGIYAGTIRNWDDAHIREANHGVRLPNAPIAVVHRDDGSGTTFVWTSYLSQVSQTWKTSVGNGSQVNWPAGAGATGNDGVADFVQKTPHSIGYVELIYAIQHQLAYAEVRNAAGQFVKADLASISAAADEAGATGDRTLSSPLNSNAKAAYPISTLTWVLVPADTLDAQKKSTLARLLAWMLTSGQKQCASLGYVPLPHDLADRAIHQLDSLK
jgi:phosphate ABC transporter phosphate-binding protein